MHRLARPAHWILAEHVRRHVLEDFAEEPRSSSRAAVVDLPMLLAVNRRIVQCAASEQPSGRVSCHLNIIDAWGTNLLLSCHLLAIALLSGNHLQISLMTHLAEFLWSVHVALWLHILVLLPERRCLLCFCLLVSLLFSLASKLPHGIDHMQISTLSPLLNSPWVGPPPYRLLCRVEILRVCL